MRNKEVMKKAIEIIIDKELQDYYNNASRSCLNCENSDCKKPIEEKYTIYDDGELSGSNCINWCDQYVLRLIKK